VVHQGHLVVGHSRRLWGRRRHFGRRFSCVRRRFVPRALLVRPEARQLRVGAMTHVTLVGPLPGVQAHVVSEGGRLAEAAVAEAADERLVQSVDAHVGAQVAAGVEAAVADDAAHPTGGDRGGGRGARGRALAGVGVLWQRGQKRGR